VRDIKSEPGSGGTGVGPEVFESLTESTTAQGDDGVGAAYGPEHAELLEADSDIGRLRVDSHAKQWIDLKVAG
jgi:hypothetical protein